MTHCTTTFRRQSATRKTAQWPTGRMTNQQQQQHLLLDPATWLETAEVQVQWDWQMQQLLEHNEQGREWSENIHAAHSILVLADSQQHDFHYTVKIHPMMQQGPPDKYMDTERSTMEAWNSSPHHTHTRQWKSFYKQRLGSKYRLRTRVEHSEY